MSKSKVQRLFENRREAVAKLQGLTDAQVRTLYDLSMRSSGDEAWWHDLPSPTREKLFEKGLIVEALVDGKRVRCHGRHEYSHPGYVRTSYAGQVALARFDADFRSFAEKAVKR